MSQIEAPVGWVPVGQPTLAPASRLPTGPVQHGTQAARVVGAQGEGLEWKDFAEVDLTELQAYVSVHAMVAVSRGAVQLQIIDGEGTAYPLGDNIFDSNDPALRALSIGGERIQEDLGLPRTVKIKVRLTVSALDPATDDGEFFIDGVSVTQSRRAYPQQARMGPLALFQQAGLLLRREGGQRPLVYDASAWATGQPVEPGDTVTVEEQGEAPVRVRTEEVTYDLPIRDPVQQRQARFTEAKQRLKSLLRPSTAQVDDSTSGSVSQNATTYVEGGGSIESVFGREGEIQAEAGDYTADLITLPDGTAVGAETVMAALEAAQEGRGALSERDDKIVASLESLAETVGGIQKGLEARQAFIDMLMTGDYDATSAPFDLDMTRMAVDLKIGRIDHPTRNP